MRQIRILAVNVQTLLQNRLMIGSVAGFLILMMPLASLSIHLRGSLMDSGLFWALLLQNAVIGYFIASVSLSVLSRPFSFMLPGSLESPVLLLILLGILLNLIDVLYLLPDHITRSSALQLFSLFMLGNACFLVPAILGTFLGSGKTFLGFFIPVLVLPLIVYERWGMTSEPAIHPVLGISLGLLTWIFVWHRWQDRGVRRLLVGRTDFELTVFDKTRTLNWVESLLEAIFVKKAIRARNSSETNGMTGAFYVVMGRLSYRVWMVISGLLFFLMVEAYLFDNSLRTMLLTYLPFLIVPLTFILLLSARLPSYYFQLPLSRRTMTRVVIRWNLCRTTITTIFLFTGLVILAWAMPDVDRFTLMIYAGAPLYVSPFLSVLELFFSTPLLVLLLFSPMMFWPHSLLLDFVLLIASWSLLPKLIAWRFRRFDLAGSRDVWRQAWHLWPVRVVIATGAGLFLFVVLRSSRPSASTLDRRLISADNRIRETAIGEFPGLSAAEKEQSIDFLIETLRRPIYPERYQAAETLGRLGWRAQRALPDIIAALKENSSNLPYSIPINPQETLGLHVETTRADVLKVYDTNLEWMILTALDAWGPAARPAADVIYPLLHHSDKYIRAMAARTLAAMQVPDAARADILNELAVSTGYINKDEAEKSIDTLGSLGPAAQSTLPALVKAAGSLNLLKQAHAEWAIGRMGVKTEEVIKVLTRGIRSLDDNVEINALIAFFQIDPNSLKSIQGADVALRKFRTQRTLDAGLFYAAYADTAFIGDLMDAGTLIDLGANINAKGFFTGQTPLMIAAQTGHADMVRLLLDKGADPSIRSTAQGTFADVKEPVQIGLWELRAYWLADHLGVRRFFREYKNQTAMAYVLQADLSPDVRKEIVQLLISHDPKHTQIEMRR